MIRRTATFAAGMTLGGLVVGSAEALYRGVSIGYAAALYGALWALASVAASLALGVRLRERKDPRALLAWGLAAALVPSTLVIARFVILRDLLHEAPGSGLRALAGGLVAAGLVAALLFGAQRWVLAKIPRHRAAVGWPWLFPLLVLAWLGLLTRTPDDALALDRGQPRSVLAGEGVILVVVDTVRADALGAYGAPPHRGKAASPHFDAFAHEGRLFTDLSAQASWTRPAVATILTARHVSGHDTMAKAAVLPAALPTVAGELQKAGVATAAVVTNYNLEEGFGFDRGFGEFHYLAPARYLGAPQRADRLAAYNVYRLLRERLASRSREARYFYRSARETNAVAFDVLERIGNQKFFVWLHYMEPHDPYFSATGESYARVSDPHPPVAWAEAMRAAYRDEIQRFDDGLGELVAGLEARGLSERTTVIVTSDHGEEFGEHGGFYHGVTLYEEQLHVPLAIRGPGIVPSVDTTLVRQIDIAPTVLGRFGLTGPTTWEGRDVLGARAAPDVTIAEEDHEGNALRAIRRGRDKLILANQANPRGLDAAELFDLGRDPAERAKRDAAQPVARELQTELDRRQAAARRGGAVSTERRLDTAAAAELRALGYVQ